MAKKYLFMCRLGWHILVTLLLSIVQCSAADSTSERTNGSAIIFPYTETTSSNDMVTGKFTMKWLHFKFDLIIFLMKFNSIIFNKKHEILNWQS